MTIKLTGRTAWIWAIAGLAAAVSLFAVLVPGYVPVQVVRSLVFLQLALTGLNFALPRATTRLLMPVFLLPVMALVFYVVAPLAFAALSQSSHLPVDFVGASTSRYLSYVGSPGEFIVLQFASACLLAALAIGRKEDEAARRKDPVGSLPKPSRHTVIIAACLISAAATCLKLIDAKVAPFSALPLLGLGGEIHAALPPVAYFCLATAIFLSLSDTPRAFFATVLWACGCIFVFLLSDLARIPLAFALFTMTMVVAVERITLARLTMVLATTLLVIGIATAGANSYRLLIAQVPMPFWQQFERSFSSKFLVRQAVSAWCFEEAVKQHWDTTEPALPLSALAGLVPRAVWPGKPSLSRGSEYAARYCGAVIDPANPHSEALTLLAEPVMEGGKFGMFAGEAGIILLIAFASVIMRRLGAIGIITGTAMLPWLTAVEQHLAFYVANGLKTLILMLPLALALYWFALSRRHEDTRQ